MAVFTRRLTDDLAGLVKKIDETVAKNQDKQMKAFVIYLTDDPDSAEGKLEEVAKKLSISKSTPLTVFANGEGPDSYKIADGADVTVLMWNKMRVQANAAFAKGAELSDDDVKAVMAETAKILK